VRLQAWRVQSCGHCDQLGIDLEVKVMLLASQLLPLDMRYSLALQHGILYWESLNQTCPWLAAFEAMQFAVGHINPAEEYQQLVVLRHTSDAG